MKQFISICSWTCALMLLLVPATPVLAQETKSGAKRPNVLFILADDLGYADLGCFGSKFYDTPHLDKLAGEGVRFTNAYAACPVCSPTRVSIMTGRYPNRSGITDYIGGSMNPSKWGRNTPLLPAKNAPHMPHEDVSLAEALKADGYATFFAGKWHLGGQGFWPEDQGFDVNMGGIDRGGPYGGKKYFSPYGNPRLEDGPPGEHLPDRLASEAVKFIGESVKNKKPFLTYLSFYSVHTPLISRKDLREKYETKKKSLHHQGQRFEFKDGRPHRLMQDHPTYAGMVEAMDLAVGKVLDGLHTHGVADNTIIFFMSDNGGLSTSEGWPTSNLPLRAGKGWIYEGGIREPVIVKWPGVTKAGSTSEQLITSTDFFPTILEITGSKAPAGRTIDGKSFVSTLKSGTITDRGAIFWHYPHYGNQGGRPNSAVREGDWKLIRQYEDERMELFNIKSDPGEKKDLAAKNPERVKTLTTKLDQWLKETGAKFPTKNPRFKPTQVPADLEKWKKRKNQLELQHAKY